MSGDSRLRDGPMRVVVKDRDGEGAKPGTNDEDAENQRKRPAKGRYA
jgi:hypothetical protein